jgi:Protein of unknown function (DUF1501)
MTQPSKPVQSLVQHSSSLDRREFLRRAGVTFGSAAAVTLFGHVFGSGFAFAESSDLAPRTPPLPAKAKAIIHIFAAGAPSHLDTFDPKPALETYADKPLPGQGGGVCFPSPFTFAASGKSGLLISSAFPKLATMADELCVIRSMTVDVPAHGPAAKMMHTGSLIQTKPSVGSWTLFGLGSGNRSLPGFITLGGSAEWRQAAFLPSMYQGTRADFANNKPVDRVLSNLRNDFSAPTAQRKQLDLIGKLNQDHLARFKGDEQLEARMESFELAYRMETEAMEAFDLNKESKEVRELYGRSDLGAKLLVARRLVERGVRFVQIEAGGWDHHSGLFAALSKSASAIDQPAAALLADLKRLGLLDSTVVWWGGEFGRTVTTASRVATDSGRDHHGKCFCAWLAGGGVKGGTAYGETDELGYEVVSKPVQIHDLHATLMRLIGYDHTKLTYRYNGRDFRLTDNFGHVMEGIIA